MSLRRLRLVPVLICLLLGCKRTPPPVPAVNRPDSEEAADTQAQRAVSFLIDGVRDEAHHRELFSQVQSLQDAGARYNSYGTNGAYFQDDTYIRISPIQDLEAAAARVGFGRVRAVDSADRIILVEAAVKPEPRPAQGWPGAEAVNQYVLGKTARFAAQRVYGDLVKKHGRARVAVVWMPDQPGLAPGDYPLVKALCRLAPETLATPFPGYGPRQKGFTTATVAPVQNFGDVVKAVEGAAVLAVDEERRVVLLGELADLKPAAAVAGKQGAAKAD